MEEGAEKAVADATRRLAGRAHTFVHATPPAQPILWVRRAVAAHTQRPVIGVPIDSGPLQGFDALLSTAQMPGGIPVATVAVGQAGAKNAGYLAAQVLATADAELHERIVADRAANRDKVAAQDASVQASLKS